MAVGAMTILTSVMQFAMLPLQGLGQGAQPIISFNYGAHRNDRVKQAFRYLLTVSLSYSALLWCVSMFGPQVRSHVYSRSRFIGVYQDSAADLYGMSAAFWNSDGLSDDVYLLR